MSETHVDANDHVWKETESQGNNENFTDVICILCGVPGQLSNKTKMVFYPAT